MVICRAYPQHAPRSRALHVGLTLTLSVDCSGSFVAVGTVEDFKSAWPTLYIAIPRGLKWKDGLGHSQRDSVPKSVSKKASEDCTG